MSSYCDPTSELPDEILVDIMSQIKMKEMVQTSVFSHRWRHVWTSMRNLNFDASETLHDKTKSVEAEKTVYIRCVNEVIRRHQANNIDQFVVVFSLDETCSSDIDGWISFALRKSVRNLKLDLRNAYGHQSNCYTFPRSLETSTCTSLVSLTLSKVNVSGEVLEKFLCSCVNLELVSVSGSETLQRLSVDGPSLKLKRLEIFCCPELIWINLSAPCLVSFKFVGQMIDIRLVNLPKLVELSVRGRYGKYIYHTLPKVFRSVLSQLETLTYEACTDEKTQKYMRFPEFTNLKYLKLIFTLDRGYFFMGYASLIEALPSLYKLTLQMPRTYKPCTMKVPKEKRCPHNIKVVEFDGFQGCAADFEFAMYLIENAIALEKIVFDTRRPNREGMWYEIGETGDRDSAIARQRAEQLGEELPSGVELIII